jgi:dTMP kinase
MEQESRGRFIVFEGIDGSGKGTQLALLAKKLAGAGVPVWTTEEPTNDPIGLLIHQHMAHEVEFTEAAVAGLFVADRVQHILNEKDGILKKLEEGLTVLGDRYYFSSYAYHSRAVPMQWVINANSYCASLLRPDVTLFIDVNPETCFERLRSSRAKLERNEKLGELIAIRRYYLEAFERLSGVERVEMIDGNQNVSAVADQVSRIVRTIV